MRVDDGTEPAEDKDGTTVGATDETGFMPNTQAQQ